MSQSITIRKQNDKWVGEYFGKNAVTMGKEFGTDAIAQHSLGADPNAKLAAYAKRHKIEIEVVIT